MLKIIRKTSVKLILLIIFFILLIFGFAFRHQIYKQIQASKAYYNVYLGDKCYKKGSLHEAINYYNKALEIYPEHVKAQYNLGNIYVVYEDYQKAVQCYEKALKYDPHFINARIDLGLVLSEQIKDYNRAISEYEKAIESKPFIIKIPYLFDSAPFILATKATAYYNMGLAYRSKSMLNADDIIQSRKFLRKAAECYQESNKIDNNRYETHYNRALTLHLLGNFAEATTEYCKALNLGPLNYDVHYNFAILLRDRKVYDQSVSELEKAALILDTSTHSINSRYVFDVLREVNQKAINQKRYYHLVENIDDKKDEKVENGVQLTYVNGKVVISEELDNAILENMRYCKSCEGI